MPHALHRLDVENISIAYGAKTILKEVSFKVSHGARALPSLAQTARANQRFSRPWWVSCRFRVGGF